MEELKDGWRRVKLGEVAEYISNKINTSELNKNNYISTENMIVNRGGVTKATNIPQNAKVNCFSENDILFSNIRTYFKKLWKADFNGGASNDVLIIRSLNSKNILNDYLYYIMSEEKFFDYTVNTSKGTKMPRGDKAAIMQYEFYIPEDIKVQQKIASILSALDDKIELNNEMNKTLEEMAQTLFKRWFIDFDFPNENGEPYRSSGGKMVESELGEIPEGWEVSDIYKISNVIYGAPFKSKQFNEEKKGFPLIRIRDLKTFNPQFFTEENHPKKTLVHPGDLLVGMDAEFRATPWLGKIGVLNQRVCMFSPNKDVVGKYFLKMILEKPLSFFENSKVATTVIHLGKSDIDMIKIICPNDLILEKFKELTEYIYQKKINNAQEIQSLTEIRDTLLPKLMSGEIDM